MRGHSAGAAAIALVLAAMTAALGASAASAACPNEAFRTGPSAQLSECRAYEMVTPVDKEGGEGIAEQPGFPVHASASGDGIYFGSRSAFAGSQGNGVLNQYIATRLGDAWGTAAIGGPQAVTSGILTLSTVAVSDDLGLALDVSKEALAPGAIAGGSNLYVRDNRTGAYTTAAAIGGNSAFNFWSGGGQGSPFVDATRDWSDILLESNSSLDPGAPENAPSLYEFREGRLRLAVAEAVAASRDQAAPNVMSADGSRFYFLKGGRLYSCRRGGEPLLVSEDEAGNPINVEFEGFVGADPGGEVAFFQNGFLGPLYRFDAAAPQGERSTRISVGPAGETASVLKASSSEDGSTVYFAAAGQLTPDAPPLEGGIGYDLYVWREGAGLRYIAQADVEELGPLTASVSTDGRFLGFESYGRVTPDVTEEPAKRCPSAFSASTGRCSNVFLYSYDDERIVCVSCDGSIPTGNSQLGGKQSRNATDTAQRAVLDDGTIFFDSPNALAPRDVNGALDAYSWRGGSAQLISGGTDPEPSSFLDAAPDGSDVFFRTRQSLVGQDIDTSADVYDARVDGGLPQGATVPSPSCAPGNDCQAADAPGRSPTRPGTGTVGGAREGGGACPSLLGRARAAKKRSRALARRAKAAKGRRAKALRRSAARAAKTAKKLGLRAGDCTGGGR